MFSSFKTDPDAYLRPAFNSNRVERYQHILTCIDNILDFVEESERFLREDLGKIFTLKEK